MRTSFSRCLSPISLVKRNPSRGLNQVREEMKSDTTELDRIQTCPQILRQRRTSREEENAVHHCPIILKQRNEKVLPKKDDPQNQPRKQEQREKGKSFRRSIQANAFSQGCFEIS